MSPTILRELLVIQHSLTTRYAADDPSDQDASFEALYLNHERLEMLRDVRTGLRASAVNVLVGQLPERRYYEAMEREEDARVAAGGREICPDCGERAVKSQDVCTLGYPGHPGAEFSVYRTCENCDYKEL